MIMCEKDQGFHWGYDLFHDPFAPSGYYGTTNAYNDGNYYDVHYASGDPSHSEQTHLHSSALTYDLFHPSIGIYHPGNEGGHDHETIYIEPSSSSFCPEGDDYFAMDGEVGKRFYPMVPVRHVPRINGDIPSVDEATLDHQRLTERLRLYELVEHKVQGDGNCQFRALSDQLYQSPEHHEFVREQVTNQLRTNRDIYDGYVPMAYDDYLEKLSRYVP